MGDQYRSHSGESSPHSDESGGHYGRGHDSSSIREQDRLLPIANVGRIMKKGLPSNAKISKDAKETVQECVSEFISFITGEASDKCQREKRKTVNGDDLLWAMITLGFEDYVEPLRMYLHRYRELEGEKVTMAKQGDQSSTKEGLSSAPMSGSSNLAVHPQMQLVHDPSYGQPQMYGQHPMMAAYGMHMHNAADASSDQLQ
ncbi:hypothetical protein O6H91_01G006600 [Diphasiastrum complanatum]|uniref:Uncharacterized protein n=1 Tax=Diphasiastrum complanatum TaxID=34168 RepID=A0ACC2EMR4_DIPCM|nr:hypothetical protein O6H91_01G006600 [Diphasiastrum complanatum]